MSPDQYKQARKALSLTIQEAGQWLGAAPATAQRWAQKGPPASAAKAIQYAIKYGLE